MSSAPSFKTGDLARVRHSPLPDIIVSVDMGTYRLSRSVCIDGDLVVVLGPRALEGVPILDVVVLHPLQGPILVNGSYLQKV